MVCHGVSLIPFFNSIPNSPSGHKEHKRCGPAVVVFINWDCLLFGSSSVSWIAIPITALLLELYKHIKES